MFVIHLADESTPMGDTSRAQCTADLMIFCLKTVSNKNHSTTTPHDPMLVDGESSTLSKRAIGGSRGGDTQCSPPEDLPPEQVSEIH